MFGDGVQLSNFLLHKIEGYHGGIRGEFKFQMFGYKVSFVHLWKKIKGGVKTMFGHKEFGGHFKKYSLIKHNENY
jgi:hypothetical protein